MKHFDLSFETAVEKTTHLIMSEILSSFLTVRETEVFPIPRLYLGGLPTQIKTHPGR